jgi:23S rRNA (cytosine1962-C5)-methyltransferase
MQAQALRNRLQKNHKKLKSYLEKNGIEAFRLYDKDIPEYPYLIDLYGTRAVIYEQGKKLDEEETPIRESHQNDIRLALSELFGIEASQQFFKVPLNQESEEFFTVQEPPLKFRVNLERYLDTGLFLDHRPLRQFLLSNSQGKRALNLFSYTCALSVAAAKGGASLVTSIDMSNTYLEWGIENFKLNGLDARKHKFLQADILKYLPKLIEQGDKFDLILLDPPSFSNSKRMEEDLDIERDHPLMIRDCMKLLSDGGTLHFSTNKRKFELHPIVSSQYQVKETSHWTIPQDFHRTEIHRSFSLSKK